MHRKPEQAQQATWDQRKPGNLWGKWLLQDRPTQPEPPVPAFSTNEISRVPPPPHQAVRRVDSRQLTRAHCHSSIRWRLTSLAGAPGHSDRAIPAV